MQRIDERDYILIDTAAVCVGGVKIDDKSREVGGFGY